MLTGNVLLMPLSLPVMNVLYPAVCLPFSVVSAVLCDRVHPWFTRSVYAGHRGKGQKVGEYGRLQCTLIDCQLWENPLVTPTTRITH
jgi:hypothetical protein